MIQQIDDAVLNFFDTLQSEWLNDFMIFVSFLGNSGWIWIVTAIFLLCFKRTRHGGAVMALALIFGLVICNLTLKPLVARIRPFDANELTLLIEPPTDWSFPSGHTCSSFAAAVGVGLALKKHAWWIMLPAVLIALSRLYLQVHYLSDVLAGAVLGALCAVAAYYILKAVQQRLKKQ